MEKQTEKDLSVSETLPQDGESAKKPEPKKPFVRFFTARNIAYLGVLTVLVVVLQCCAGFIQIAGVSLSFVLVPIVLGGILLGPWAGAFLGFLFGFIVLMYGVAGTEPFTATLLGAQPALTVITIFVKGLAAGIVPALLYRLISKKNTLAGVFVASIAAPILNTGIFILGLLAMTGTLKSFGWVSDGSSLAYFIFIGCAGINFLVEFAINIALSPAIHTVVRVVEKKVGKKKKVVEDESESVESADAEPKTDITESKELEQETSEK